MPFIPLIAAGVGAAGAAISSASANSAADAKAQQEQQAQQQAQQQALANAQQAINSPQAQAAQAATAQQQAFANQVLTPGSLSGLTNQLQAASQGQGPNPALAQLNQTTGQNVQNQAALMAGQRGAGSNVGLESRQIAQQGAATQQQAVGQAATLGAQQQIAARQQLQQQLGMGLQTQQAATQAALQGQGITTQALTGAGQQGTQLAGQAMGVQGQLGLQSNQFNNQSTAGAIGGLGTALQTGIQGLSNQSALNGSQYQGVQGTSYAEGGDVGPKSSAGKFMSSLMMAHGGKVPAMVSPGERYLSPKEVQKVAEGKKSPMKAGEKIQGKPKVGGAKNSYANDTVPKTLEEGGIVLPRSVTQAKNPGKEAAKFVTAILAKNRLTK